MAGDKWSNMSPREVYEFLLSEQSVEDRLTAVERSIEDVARMLARVLVVLGEGERPVTDIPPVRPKGGRRGA